jgi:hypothetical protein
MQDFNLNDIAEFNDFMSKAIESYTHTKKRVDRIKDLLLKEPGTSTRSHSKSAFRSSKLKSLLN